MNLIWKDIRLLCGKFVSNWKQYLAIHLAVNVLIFVLLAPLAMLLLRLAIALSGDQVLSDQDIVFFILSPLGLVSFFILISVFSIIVFLEFSAIITAAWRSSPGKTASVKWILTTLAFKAPVLFRLAATVLLKVILNTIPFALMLGLVYYFYLSDYDINYYLATTPPEWHAATTWAALISLAWGLHLLRLFIGWIFCLPIVLLDGTSPSASLERSSSAVRGKRPRIAAWLLGWLLLSTLAAALVSAPLAGAGSDFIHFSVVTDSMNALLLALSLVSLAGFVVSFAATFVSTTLLSLLILKLFEDSGFAGDIKKFQSAEREVRFPFVLSRRALAGSLMAGVVISAIVVYGLIEEIEFEDRTEIMAHRGASRQAPENTMAAVRAAIDSGAQWIEIDVQETVDGEVVVIHDSDLKKIGGVPLAVASSTLEELRQVDIGSWFDAKFSDERIPTLEQVLKVCKGRIRINIELKYYGAQKQLEERVGDIVDANGMADQVVVMSLSLEGIRRMRQVRPDWSLGLLSSVSVGDLAALEVEFLALNARFASRHLIRRMHQEGKRVMVWTVNDPMGMSSMAGRGVDVIITDEPALAVSLMKQREQLDPAERMLMQLADIFEKPSLYREQ